MPAASRSLAPVFKELLIPELGLLVFQLLPFLPALVILLVLLLDLQHEADRVDHADQDCHAHTTSEDIENQCYDVVCKFHDRYLFSKSCRRRQQSRPPAWIVSDQSRKSSPSSSRPAKSSSALDLPPRGSPSRIF